MDAGVGSEGRVSEGENGHRSASTGEIWREGRRQICWWSELSAQQQMLLCLHRLVFEIVWLGSVRVSWLRQKNPSTMAIFVPTSHQFCRA